MISINALTGADNRIGYIKKPEAKRAEAQNASVPGLLTKPAAVTPELAMATLGIQRTAARNNDMPGAEIINKLPFADKLSPDDKKNLGNVLNKKDEEAGYVLKMIDLAKENKVTPYALATLCEHGRTADSAKSDIDRYYAAQASGKTIEDEFVPLHKNTTEAQKSVPVGEVFRVEGQDKIYVRTGEDKSKQLKMDSETYLKLFPPVARFASSQGGTGDCYLLSSINSIMENPEGRVTLYDRFEQVQGGVNVSMPESKAVLYCPDCKLPKGVDTDKFSVGSPATQMLELAYGADFEQIKFAEYETTVAESLKEFEYRLIKLESKGTKSKKDAKKIQKLKAKIEGYKKGRELVRTEMAKPGHKLTFVLDDYDNFVIGQNGPMTKPVNQIDSEYKSPADFYRGGTGGFTNVVLDRFGFETQSYIIGEGSDEEKLDKILTGKNPEQYIIAAGTYQGTSMEGDVAPEYSIYSSHAYKITPEDDENGKRVFRVNNPWNTSHTITMGLEKLKEFFQDFSVAKVKE